MSKIILDDRLRDELQQNGTVVELCDKNGQTIMFALSLEEMNRLISAWAKSEFEKDDGELPIDDADDVGSMTTSELLSHLESLKARGGTAA